MSMIGGAELKQEVEKVTSRASRFAKHLQEHGKEEGSHVGEELMEMLSMKILGSGSEIVRS